MNKGLLRFVFHYILSLAFSNSRFVTSTHPVRAHANSLPWMWLGKVRKACQTIPTHNTDNLVCNTVAHGPFLHQNHWLPTNLQLLSSHLATTAESKACNSENARKHILAKHPFHSLHGRQTTFLTGLDMRIDFPFQVTSKVHMTLFFLISYGYFISLLSTPTLNNFFYHGIYWATLYVKYSNPIYFFQREERSMSMSDTHHLTCQHQQSSLSHQRPDPFLLLGGMDIIHNSQALNPRGKLRSLQVPHPKRQLAGETRYCRHSGLTSIQSRCWKATHLPGGMWARSKRLQTRTHLYPNWHTQGQQVCLGKYCSKALPLHS